MTSYSKLAYEYLLQFATRLSGESLVFPTYISAPPPRLFALIIAINNYSCPTIRKLNGAVRDAEAVKHYLENSLFIPPTQIIILTNQQAKRTAIINAFKQLATNENIKNGDPILIYYAGHGKELKAPEDWETENGKVQSIIPQDCDDKRVPPITDRTIGALLEDIAKVKGDNITVIFDCCHSGSGSRITDIEDPSHTARSPSTFSVEIPSDLDREIWDTTVHRGQKIPAAFLHTGLRSHILLAACAADEKAVEDISGGQFTQALLSLLRKEGTEKLRYTDILKLVDAIPGQNPQCEGMNKGRFIFNGKSPSPGRVCYPVTYENGTYTVSAGVVHGISDGAEFAVHKNRDFVEEKPAGFLTVSVVKPFTSILQPKGSHFPLEAGAIALQTKPGEREDVALYVSLDHELTSVFEAVLRRMENPTLSRSRVSLVEKENAKLQPIKKDGKVVFNILDRRVQQYGLTCLPYAVNDTVDDIFPALNAIAHYYWHLDRNIPMEAITSRIDISINRLEKVEGQFDPASLCTLLRPTEPNLYKNGRFDLVVDANQMFGIKITNNTTRDLYLSAYFFDNSDLSITPYFEPPAEGRFKVDPQLRKGGGSITVGYGAGGGAPFTYFLRDGQDIDVGFIKFFFSTRYVDLSHVQQTTPFGGFRAGGRVKQVEEDLWSSILIPVVQRRYAPDEATSNMEEAEVEDVELEVTEMGRLQKDLKEAGNLIDNLNNENTVLQKQLAQIKEASQQQVTKLQKENEVLRNEIADLRKKLEEAKPRSQSRTRNRFAKWFHE